MNGGVASAQLADDAIASDPHEPRACEMEALRAEPEADQAQLKTKEMHALLARAVEAGQFDGGRAIRSITREATLLRVLAQLESAKDQLDRVRLRG